MMKRLTNRLLLVDLETSGTNPAIHSPLAVALVPLFGDRDPLLIYVRSEVRAWTPFARNHFDRFAAEWSRSALDPVPACDLIEDYLYRAFDGQEVTLVGHNVGFDLAFLKALAYAGGREGLRLLSHRSIDTHTLLYLLCLQGRVPPSALTSDGAFAFFGIAVPDSLRHTALADAFATRDLFVSALRLFLGRHDATDRELASALIAG